MSTLPATAPPDAPAPAPAPPRTAADVFMRRLLRVDGAGPRPREAELRSAFSRSIAVSAVRCLLTYILIPFVGPLLGLAAGVAPWVGIPLSALAIVFNVRSMRRFWRADHRWRWGYTAVGTSMVVLLLVLIGLDVADLLG